MLSRRRFLTGTVATGLALATQRVQLLVAQPAKRLIVDAQIHMWKANSPDRPWVEGARPQIPGTEAPPITIMMRNDSASMILLNSVEIESFSRGHPASTSCRRPSLLGVGVIGGRRSPGPRRRGPWMCALKIRKT